MIFIMSDNTSDQLFSILKLHDAMDTDNKKGLHRGVVLLEVTSGFEPLYEVLQTSA